MCAVSSSDSAEFGFQLPIGSKKEMEFHGCCGRHAISRGGLDTKYELGQGKPEYFEPSLLGAAL